MRPRRSLAIPFYMALFLHAVGVVCAGHLLVRRILSDSMVPEFQHGESSLELTLLSPSATPDVPVPVAPPPQPEVKIEDPVPVAPSETVPVSIAEPLKSHTDQMLAVDPNADKSVTEGPDRPGQSMDADTLQKGVESGVCPTAAIRPVYPLGSRLRGEEGLVVINVKVNTQGEVEAVSVVESSGYSGLDNAAIKAVKKAKFNAARNDGVPREGEARLTVRFRLVD